MFLQSYYIYIFLIIVPDCFNNKRVNTLADEMLNAPAPEYTEIIEMVAGWGNSTGTGDHAEIWLGLLIKSELQEDDLFDYYSDLYDMVRVHKVTSDKYSGYLKTMDMLHLKYKSVDNENLSDYNGYYIIGRIESAPFTFLQGI